MKDFHAALAAAAESPLENATAAAEPKGGVEAQSLLQGEGALPPREPDLERAAKFTQMERQMEEDSVRRSSWRHVSMTLMGEIMGTGVLSLPFATAQLGWVIGLSSCVLFGLASAYTGVLLSRLKNGFYPDAHSYGDLATLTFGPRCGAATRGAIGGLWALILPYYLMATVSSLIVALPDAGLCYWQWALLVAAALLPALQLRSLHAISYAAGASTAAMLVAVALILGELSLRPREAAPTRAWPREGGLLRLYASFGSFIFAYQGHSIFLELMREMREPRSFPRAVKAANGALIGVYALTSAVGYRAAGDGVAPFLPSTLRAGALRRAVGLLLAFHVAVGCLIVAQPLHAALHRALFPRSAAGGGGAAARWLLLSGGTMALAIVVANAVPFFADFQNLIGSLLGAPIMFGFPAACYLRACRLHQRAVPPLEAAACWGFAVVLTPLFTLLGTANALLDIATRWEAMGEPFACMLEGYRS